MPDVRETQRTEHLNHIVETLRQQPGGYTEVYEMVSPNSGNLTWFFTSLNRFGVERQPCANREDAFAKAYAWAQMFEDSHPNHPRRPS
jgi:hypothetical protein